GFLRQPGKGHVDWSWPGHVGLLGAETNNSPRATRPSISRRNFQSAEPCEFQYAESDSVYSFRSLGDCRNSHEHVHDLAADSVRVEIDLVGRLLLPSASWVADEKGHGFAAPYLVTHVLLV